MITKAALLLFREVNGIQQLMFVRAHNKSFFVFPGGKQEANETIDDALRRELREELGVTAENIKQIGVVQGKTPDGRPLKMHLYIAELIGIPNPHAEIVEIKWLSKQRVLGGQFEMTPMTLKHVVPFLEQSKIW